MNKEICSRCKKNVAVWDYMPGFSSGRSPYFCDECVSRGCECNHNYVDIDSYHPPLENPELPEGEENIDWKWIEKNKVWTNIDHKGREYPCVEFTYDENGWEVDDE
jgi:hypothetical protein